MDEVDLTSGTAAIMIDEPEVKPIRVRTDQDQLKANYAGEVERQIAAILLSADTAMLVAARGLTAEKLAVGQAKVAAFQATVNAKQQGLVSIQSASAALKETFAEAKRRVTDLRESARIAYPKDTAAQQRLGATAKVPGDQEMFLSAARAYGNVARQESHATALLEVGFDSVAYETALEAFAAARAAFTVSEQSRKQATATRNAAFQELKDWAQPFRRAVKLALKTHPELLKPLGL